MVRGATPRASPSISTFAPGGSVATWRPPTAAAIGPAADSVPRGNSKKILASPPLVTLTVWLRNCAPAPTATSWGPGFSTMLNGVMPRETPSTETGEPDGSEVTATDPLSGSAAARAATNQYARRPPCAMVTTASKGNAMVVRQLERLAGFTTGSSLAAWPRPRARAVGVWAAVSSAGTNRKTSGRGRWSGSGDDALNSRRTAPSFRQNAMVETRPTAIGEPTHGSSELSIAGVPSPPESRESTCKRRQGEDTSVRGRRYLSRTGLASCVHVDGEGRRRCGRQRFLRFH